MRISSLSLSAFRNYDHVTLPILPGGLIALIGPNGAGKTNILEAISLLTPGRGLRSADLHAIQNRNQPDNVRPWSIHARIGGQYGEQELGLGMDPVSGRRIIKLNGDILKTQTERAELMKCVWLTPAHDRLFLDGASIRRKLIDRWVFTADPAHAGRINRFEKLLSERNKVLAADAPDPLWLDALEQDLSETGLAVAAARVDYTARLLAQIEKLDDREFPRAHLQLSGFLEDRIGHEPALQIETDYRAMLKTSRAKDKAVEATTIGPHRSDLVVHYAAKDMPASECSTGEQKALLFSLFLAHTKLIRDEWGDAPVLLLDEMTAHLDRVRRDALLARVGDMGAQVFMTATSAEPFADIAGLAMIEIKDGRIEQEQKGRAA